MSNAVIVGGGIFGLTTAIELCVRGHDVTIFDPGPIPHPLAESTDISKVVRLDYGADEDYAALGERALEGWRRWNDECRDNGHPPLYHETGVTFLSRTPMQPGSFEYESYEVLRRRGHALERLDADAIAARFPAYREGALVDGYFNPVGGWAEASAAVRFLAERAQFMGIEIREERVERIDAIDADLVIVCAGAWVPRLVPELAGSLRAIGQPVFHLAPADPSLFEAARFPVFGADISRTGYYGFPANRDGIVKIANHGTGIAIASPGFPGARSDANASRRSIDDNERFTNAAQEAALREFVRDTFPALVDAPIVHTRLCVYCDTIDEHFWIAHDPARPHVTIATGGSGHAFKFGPALGSLIADIALDVPHPLAAKFRWRPELVAKARGDAARHSD
jgi:glycine/D-amino acid oxidase-like deaminating enzyme